MLCPLNYYSVTASFRVCVCVFERLTGVLPLTTSTEQFTIHAARVLQLKGHVSSCLHERRKLKYFASVIVQLLVSEREDRPALLPL